MLDLLRDDFLRVGRSLSGFLPLCDIWPRMDRRVWKRNELCYAQTLRLMAERVNLLWGHGGFWCYEGRIWVRVEEGEIRLAFQRFLEEMYIPDMFLTGAGIKAYKLNFLDVVRYRNLLRERFDIVAFENGVLDMRDFTLHDFSPSFHCTRIKPFAYRPRAKCPLWQSFLHEVLPDGGSRAVLQMFMGLGLIERSTVFSEFANGSTAKVEVCLFLIGSGSNGKSVIQQTAMGIFGRDRISTCDYSELTRLGDEGLRSRKLLSGCVFNWSSESDSADFGKRDAVFKKMVSGEPVTERGIGQDVRENYQIPYLVFNMNETPGGAAYALMRRLQVIHFEVQIPEERQNAALAYELQSEYSGIFNWIARGAMEIRRRKYRFPDTQGGVRQKLLMMLKDNPVIAWASAYGIKRAGPKEQEDVASAAELYASFERFCLDNNVPPVSKQMFGRTLGTSARQHIGLRTMRGITGTLYKFYGCTKEDLEKPYEMDAEEAFRIEFRKNKGTFILEED